MIRFELEGTDPTGARFGNAHTGNGSFRTPAFMPVGTLGNVKTQTPDELEGAGVQIVLANAYHLACRPGEDLVQRLGGIHRFMGWNGPILTDSGGFQIFSLADCVKKTEDDVVFQRHTDGRPMRIGPERSMEIQRTLGVDIAMAFDDCPALPASPDTLRQAVDRTLRWAERCRRVLPEGDGPALFGIVQGGTDVALRVECAEAIRAIGFDGYAIGGLCVGEPPEAMRRTVSGTTPHLPTDRVRYLMGVGTPQDLVAGVEAGIDLFDCVMPTRSARNALAFTSEGPKRMRNARWTKDESPLDPDCDCPVCRRFSIAYLRHLYVSREMNAGIFVSTHNIHFYQRLMRNMRGAAAEGRFAEFRDRFLDRYEAGDRESKQRATTG